MVTGGSVLAFGEQPPASVMKIFLVVFCLKIYCYEQGTDSTLPKNIKTTPMFGQFTLLYFWPERLACAVTELSVHY
jgi:hypothetical protein